MKKVLPILLVLAMALPTLAAVSIEAIDAGNGVAEVKMTVSGTSVVRGVALEVTVTGGNATAYTVGTLPDPDLKWAFIDYYYDNGVTTLPGAGAHPIAKLDAPGAASLSNNFVFSAGILDDGGEQLGLANVTQTLFTVTAGVGATVTVTVDQLRGGVVGTDATPTFINGGSIALAGATEAIKNTAPFYNTWVAWGKPNCWAYRYNCRGDINGTAEFGKYVMNQDLAVFKNAFNKTDIELAAVTNGICADLNRSAEFGKRVMNQDLNIFKTYYNQAVTTCDHTHYNFWMLPNGTVDPVFP